MSNLLNRVDAELEIAKELNPIMAMGMIAIRKMIVEEQQDVILFHRCNGLMPTIESCTFKVIEELGELLQIIGKGNKLSGETPRLKTGDNNPLRLIEEAFDVAQSAVTMIYTIADKWGIAVDEQRELHESKLISKGYLVEAELLIPKTVGIDPSWMVCENCDNQKTGNDIHPKCETCEDSEWGRPSNFVRKKVNK